MQTTKTLLRKKNKKHLCWLCKDTSTGCFARTSNIKFGITLLNIFVHFFLPQVDPWKRPCKLLTATQLPQVKKELLLISGGRHMFPSIIRKKAFERNSKRAFTLLFNTRWQFIKQFMVRMDHYSAQCFAYTVHQDCFYFGSNTPEQNTIQKEKCYRPKL